MNNDVLLFFLKCSISIGIFYIFYGMFLKKLSFHGLKRIYLLSTLIVSVGIAFIDLSSDLAVANNDISTIQEEFNKITYTLIPIRDANTTVEHITIKRTPSSSFHIHQTLMYLYFLGTIGVLLRMIVSIYKVNRMKRKAVKRSFEGFKVYYNDQIAHSFSRFNSVFIQAHLTQDEQNIILQHELAHVRKKHTIDLLICEFFLLLQWFNPFMYLLRKSLKEIHEFQADEESIRHTDIVAYQKLLFNLSSTYNEIVFASHFQSFTLKRLKMMTRSKSKTHKLLILILLIPISSFLLLSFQLLPFSSQNHQLLNISQPKQADSGTISLSDNSIVQSESKSSTTAYRPSNALAKRIDTDNMKNANTQNTRIKEERNGIKLPKEAHYTFEKQIPDTVLDASDPNSLYFKGMTIVAMKDDTIRRTSEVVVAKPVIVLGGMEYRADTAIILDPSSQINLYGNYSKTKL